MTAKKAKAKKTTAKKTAPKTNGSADKGPGVIVTIIETISCDKGANADEIMAVLVKKFPDRDEAGMRKTVGIQANKNATSKNRDDEKRGLVYYRRGRGA
jgi:hypothetical protein